MAKNKVKAELDFDDKGDLKKIERKAKAAGKGLEKGAKGAHSMDRRLRGAAQMSSSATKNFSKMSQGISGGLVPAYAMLAASLFAIDAAFRALKRASDLRVQQEGMEAYANVTGIALKSIARDLQAATGHQLDFKEAAESTAIAISAGFSADQILKIGSAARMASIALGRDFTDSYQRMLKGITKAEPELLDELGIILRLERATKVYAATIGKVASQLTAYERQQAVFNEVLDQTERKYGAIGDAVPVSVMGQLGAKFTDLTDAFLKGIAPIAEFFGSILVESTAASIAALGVFAASILRSVIPALDTMTAKAATAWGAMTGAGRAAGASFMGVGGEWRKAKNIMFATPEKGLAQAQKVAGRAGAKGAGVEALKTGGGLTRAQLTALKSSLKKAEKQWIKHNAVISGNWKGAKLKDVQAMQQALAKMEGGTTRFMASQKVLWRSLFVTITGGWKLVAATFKTVTSGMKVVATGLGIAMNKALGIIGWIGMLIMAKDMFGKMADSWDKILINIGEGIQKISDMLTNLGDKIPLIGGLFKGLANLLDKAGRSMELKGLQMQPVMEQMRQGKAFDKRLEGIRVSYGKKSEETRSTLRSWRGTSKKFDARAAQSNLLGTSGGGQDMMNLLDLYEDMRDNEKRYKAERKDIDKSVPGVRLEEPAMDAWLEKNELMRKSLEEGVKPIADHYYLLGELDPRYKKVGEAIDALAFEEAREDLKELNREYGSHALALKDMISAEEGRSKRIAEYVVQSQELSVVGLEVQALARSLGEMSKAAFSAESHLEAFYARFGEDVLDKEGKKITKLAQAQEYANTVLAEELRLSENIRKAKLATATGEVFAAEAAGGASLFQKRAQEKLVVLQKEQAFLEYQQNAKVKLSNIEKLRVEAETAGNKDVALAYQMQIDTINKLLEARRTLKDTAADMATDMGKLKASFKESFTDGMQKGIEGLINGTKSLKEAFADMAKGILASMAKVLAQMMTQKLLKSAFGGFFSTGREGGIFSPPGYRSFATGGIASGSSGRGYGATLHGTEAVVPLPNDRSIPVTLSGGAMSTNNTSVTVNVAEGGTSSEITGESGALALGSVIAMAIEERLQNEQRPGGILHRPGGG